MNSSYRGVVPTRLNEQLVSVDSLASPIVPNHVQLKYWVAIQHRRYLIDIAIEMVSSIDF